jgi:hypothetical protein
MIRRSLHTNSFGKTRSTENANRSALSLNRSVRNRRHTAKTARLENISIVKRT